MSGNKKKDVRVPRRGQLEGRSPITYLSSFRTGKFAFWVSPADGAALGESRKMSSFPWMQTILLTVLHAENVCHSKIPTLCPQMLICIQNLVFIANPSLGVLNGWNLPGSSDFIQQLVIYKELNCLLLFSSEDKGLQSQLHSNCHCHLLWPVCLQGSTLNTSSRNATWMLCLPLSIIYVRFVLYDKVYIFYIPYYIYAI